MPRWRRAAVALIMILAALAGVWFWTRCPSDPGTILSVQCSHERGSMSATAWILELDGKGEGTLTFHGRRIAISAPQRIAELQTAMRECHVCDLPSEMGFTDVDHKIDRLRIKTTTLDKSVNVETVPRDQMDESYRCFERLWKVIQAGVDEAISSS